MNRLQFATLLSWAGDAGFKGRKRLQKLVFFLQEAGCPLHCRFTLHNFGPYSRDVADACDEIVAAGLVEETGGSSAGDPYSQYSYSLKPNTAQLLRDLHDPKLSQFQALASELINEHLWTLELGSTILFFYRQTGNWDEALQGACDFKKVLKEKIGSQRALKLAKRFEVRPAN